MHSGPKAKPEAERAVERRRLACDWLLHSNRSVNQIALDLGYSEQSAFNRAFKRWFGVTPVSYRDSGGH